MSRLVKLNVGGVQYTTSASNIAQYPDSMLAKLIEKENERQQIESGKELFIDRNGHVFKYVLEFLRNGNQLVLPDDKKVQRELALEADFYQLDGLKRLIDENRSLNLIAKLNVGGTKYEISISSMMQYPNSKLGTMIQQPEELQMIQDGEEIFIDRDGELFKYIMRYLRDGDKLALPEDDLATLTQLLLEVQFFTLDGLKAIIEKKLRLLTHDGWKIGDIVTNQNVSSPSTFSPYHISHHSAGTIVKFRADGEVAVRFDHLVYEYRPERDVSATLLMKLRRKY